jgi:tetratricopeptide (TPR) repeat protein
MVSVAEAVSHALQSQQAGNLAQAEQLYRQVLQVDPANVQALYLLGTVYQSVGRLADAVASYRQALWYKPDYVETHNHLGVALAMAGQLGEAAGHLQEAVRLAPGAAEPYSNLGIVLSMQGKPEEAMAHFQQAIRLRPDFAEAYNSLGNTLNSQHRYDEAAENCRQALRLLPAFAEAHNNLGIALKGQGKLDEAIRSYQQAIRLRAGFAEAHYNLGNVLRLQGRYAEALASYDQALRYRPEYAEAHYQRALLWLLLGRFEQGWPAYEWRWRCAEFRGRRLAQPVWDGSPLAGRTILLHAEQGFGDTLQLVRYVPLVKQRGGTVVVECQAALLPLVSRLAGLDYLVAQGAALPGFHVQASLLSLPGIFRTTLATIPASVPYLSADPALVAHWRQELDASRAFRIGIVWQGSFKHREDRHRSVPLTQFAPLARLEGVRLVSLQVGPAAAQVAAVANDFGVIDLGSRFDPASFADVAAVLMSLDLVVTVDTAVAHLAGAVGVPVWVALPLAPDFRWLLERDDSPWYPSMRLFRQPRFGDWDAVFERLTAEVAKIKGTAKSLRAPDGPGQSL